MATVFGRNKAIDDVLASCEEPDGAFIPDEIAEYLDESSR
jgi:hypothetical protein